MQKLSFLLKHGTLPKTKRNSTAAIDAGTNTDDLLNSSSSRSQTSSNSSSSRSQTSSIPPSFETDEIFLSDSFKESYQTVCTLTKKYRLLTSHINKLEQSYPKFTTVVASLFCAFEVLGEGSPDPAPDSPCTKNVTKAKQTRQIAEELQLTELPPISSKEQSLALQHLLLETAKFPAFQKLYSTLNSSSLEHDHYTSKVEAVTGLAEKTQIELGIDPSNPKLVKQNEKAQEKKIRNHEKLELASSKLTSTTNEFNRVCQDFEDARKLLISSSHLGEHIKSQGKFFRKLASSFSPFEAYQYSINSTTGEIIPPPAPVHLRKPSTGISSLTKGLRRQTINANATLSHMTKHVGKSRAKRSESVAVIEGENEYLKAESFFLVMKKDLNYLAKSIEVLVPTLGSLLDDIMNVAAVFCEIGDFYEGAQVVSQGTVFVEHVNSMKNSFGLLHSSGDISHSSNCFSAKITKNIVEPLKGVQTMFAPIEKLIQARVQIVLDYQHYLDKVETLTKQLSDARVEAEVDPNNKNINEKVEILAAKLENNLGKFELAKTTLKTDTDMLMKIFEQYEREKREFAMNDWFKELLTEGLGQWNFFADALLGAGEGENGEVEVKFEEGEPNKTMESVELQSPIKAQSQPPTISTTISSNPFGNEEEEDEKNQKIGSPTARVRGPSVPPPAAAPPAPSSGDAKKLSVEFAPPPMVGEAARRASDARKSMDGGVGVVDVKSLAPPPEAKIRSLSDRSKSIGSKSDGGGVDSGRFSLGDINEDRPSGFSHMEMMEGVKTQYGDDLIPMLREAQLKNEQECDKEAQILEEEKRRREAGGVEVERGEILAEEVGELNILVEEGAGGLKEKEVKKPEELLEDVML